MTIDNATLIERLWDVAGFVQKEYGRVVASHCLATEAADRIAALEAEVKRLREALENK